MRFIPNGCVTRAGRDESGFGIQSPGSQPATARQRCYKGCPAYGYRASDRILRPIEKEKEQIAIIILPKIRAEPGRKVVLTLRAVNLGSGDCAREAVSLKDCRASAAAVVRPKIDLLRARRPWLSVTGRISV